MVWGEAFDDPIDAILKACDARFYKKEEKVSGHTPSVSSSSGTTVNGKIVELKSSFPVKKRNHLDERADNLFHIQSLRERGNKSRKFDFENRRLSDLPGAKIGKDLIKKNINKERAKKILAEKKWLSFQRSMSVECNKMLKKDEVTPELLELAIAKSLACGRTSIHFHFSPILQAIKEDVSGDVLEDCRETIKKLGRAARMEKLSASRQAHPILPDHFLYRDDISRAMKARLVLGSAGGLRGGEMAALSSARVSGNQVVYKEVDQEGGMRVFELDFSRCAEKSGAANVPKVLVKLSEEMYKVVRNQQLRPITYGELRKEMKCIGSPHGIRIGRTCLSVHLGVELSIIAVPRLQTKSFVVRLFCFEL